MAGKVTFEQLSCNDEHHQIGVAILDNPESLNALTFEMLIQLNQQLLDWQDNDQIVCVVIKSNSEKAFCAGGDVRTMHQMMSEKSKQEAQDFCTTYFSLEYQCDYLTHTYPKPVIAWGEGIIMGGGMGLFMGASHKVVTPKSRLAMPEVSIGLFPDVGGTWFLNRLESGVGLFLGLTGTMINANDATELHLADYLLLEDHQTILLTLLRSTQWFSANDHYSVINELLEGLTQEAQAHKPPPQISTYLPRIEFACRGADLAHIWQGILDIQPTDPLSNEGKWLENAQRSMLGGSPITAHIVYRQIKHYHDLSLADCFKLELGLAVRSGVLGEFQEGVRARLIDKCGDPNWMFESIYDVDSKVIDTLFSPLWPTDKHPLAELGKY